MSGNDERAAHAAAGGAAFPHTGDHQIYPETGMTLRDYFAAKAMQGDCARTEWSKDCFDDLTSWAYGVADAMLAARSA